MAPALPRDPDPTDPTVPGDPGDPPGPPARPGPREGAGSRPEGTHPPSPRGAGPDATGSVAAALLLALVVTAAFHALLHPRIADADAFWHVGWAEAYLATSPMESAFPWTAFSVMAEEGADLWYGFHLLLLPFAAVADDPARAMQVAAVVLTAAALGTVTWLSFRHALLGAALWPALFLLAVPNVLYRYLAVRPEVLSLPLVLLLLSALVRGNRWLVLALATSVTWIHLGMFWLAPGVAVVWAATTLADRRLVGPDATGRRAAAPTSPRAPEPAAAPSVAALVGLVLAGSALGWLLRPDPLGAARLAWIQIAELLLEKTGETPLTFAVDLAPLPLEVLFVSAWPLLLAWMGALVYLVLTAVEERGTVAAVPRSERVLLWTATLLAAGFLVLTVVVARRSLVQWAAFATLGLAVVTTHLTPAVHRRGVTRLLLLAVPLLFGWSLWRNALNVRFVALPPDHLEEVATWLGEASRPGDLVFNTHWDTFGPLFARNRTNRYLGGMDPIFQYARDPEAYWSFHHLSTDVATAVTCPRPDCAPEEVRDTWTTLREDFGARWVLVEPRRNPRLSLFLLEDDRFRLALETRREAVFEVLPPGETAPRPDFLEPEGGG